MLKNKRILLIIILAVALFLIPNISKCSEIYKTTTIIDDSTIDWEYELNKEGKVTNLKCTNVSVLPNILNIPSIIDGKEVISLKFEAFKNATNLESVTIPKTLKQGSVAPVFKGCTNLTSITFEDGITVIPSNLCASMNITEVKIPNSVKEIENGAFSDCKELVNVNLGNIEIISFSAFENCTSLKGITIPKTLKQGSVAPVFKGCTNLTSITFEDGITVIPSNLCASMNITEVKIPASVTEIGANAFEDCFKLEKVTFLGDIKNIGWYILYPNDDTVFTNHNENLTVYCYEDTKIAEYVINTGIKYKYLTKEENSTTQNGNQASQTPSDTKNPSDTGTNTDTNKDTTIKNDSKLPQTGIALLSLILISLIAVAVISKVKYGKYKDI